MRSGFVKNLCNLTETAHNIARLCQNACTSDGYYSCRVTHQKVRSSAKETQVLSNTELFS